MKRLVIETATEACSVAVLDQGEVVAHVHEVVGRGHAERLIPMIAKLPDEGRADEVLVDCGPGSFTGIRVGLAAARAFGMAWAVPVRGYSSLSLIAAAGFAGGAGPERLAVAMIGGHGEYFVQLFETQPVRALSPLASLTPEAAVLLCGDLPLVGSGAAVLRAAGASGSLHTAGIDARITALLPPELVSLPPSPLYGRGPDARLPA